MTDNIIELSKHQPPVTYTVTVTQHYDGTIETFVHDVADDERSRNAVGYALRRAAEQYLSRRVGHAADDMLAIMLANVDHAMSCTEDKPAIFKVGPAELRSWAEAVERYETARFDIMEPTT